MNPSVTTKPPCLEILLARMEATPVRSRPPRPPLTLILTAKALIDAEMDDDEREEGFAGLSLIEQSRYVEIHALDCQSPPSVDDECCA